VSQQKLVSGYYVNQKSSDNRDVNKPKNKMKCSHGGLIDSDSYITNAIGGINKDSGYYLFSPRADLHQIAAGLAIKHTEYFFNQIKDKFGEKVFVDFLKLEMPVGNFGNLCASSSNRIFASSFLSFLIFFILTFLWYF
jgi:hypothetical protein